MSPESELCLSASRDEQPERIETQPSQRHKLLSLILVLRYASHQNLEFCIYAALFLTRSSGNVPASVSGHVPRSWGEPPSPSRCHR